MEIGVGQSPSKINLKEEFDWFLTERFAELKQRKDLYKEKCPPQKAPTQTVLYDSIITRRVPSAFRHDGVLSGGKNSLCKEGHLG